MSASVVKVITVGIFNGREPAFPNYLCNRSGSFATFAAIRRAYIVEFYVFPS
jgi:hypothetical protein